MSAFTEPLAQVRAALPKPQGLYGPMCECEECCDKASALAALAQVERLATDMETALRGYHDLMPALADCANECGEALLYSQAHKANEIARTALTGEETE